MKTLFACILCLSALRGFSQDWIILTTPQAGILGRPVANIKKGVLAFDPNLPYNRNPQIVEDASAESSTEYSIRLRNFTSTLFASKRVRVGQVTAYGVKVRSLGETAINALKEGTMFVAEGVCADSAEVIVSFRKNTQTDIAQIVSTLSSALAPTGATQVISKVLPFLAKAQFQSADSTRYRLVIKNPNVYYKVKVALLEAKKNLCGCDWESKCFLYFADKEGANDTFPKTTTLTVDYTGEHNRTVERHPEFCGDDNKGVRYFLALEKGETDRKLHLWLMGVSTINQEAPTGEMPKILEIPYKDVNGIRQWRLERKLIYKFRFAERLKSVLIAVSAVQTGPGSDSVNLINYRGSNSTGSGALTYIKYPEFKGKYITD